VTSQAEVQATLGVDKANQLSACTDPGCDSELAVALKADFVARGAVVVAGPSTTLALSLEDLTGKSISRAEAAVVGKATDDLLSKMNEMVPRLVQPVRDSGRWPALAAAPVSAASRSVPDGSDLGPGRIASYGLAALGGVGLVVGAAGCLFYPADLASLKDAANGSTPAVSSSAGSMLRGSVQRDETIASVGISAGLVAIGVSLALYIASGPGRTVPPSNLQFAPAPGQ
jgi:hypothetical protein